MTAGLTPAAVCCAVSPPRREPLGASSDPAGSESLPALLHHCITKAKGVAANNNNNTTSARRTGWCRCQGGWGWVGGGARRAFTRVISLALSLPPLVSRCMSLSDPAAIPDTPRGRGARPRQEEEEAEQEEPLSLFDLPAAAQAVRGGPDRHPGRCRLRRPQLWDPSLTPFAHQAIGPLTYPPLPHPDPSPPLLRLKKEA